MRNSVYKLPLEYSFKKALKIYRNRILVSVIVGFLPLTLWFLTFLSVADYNKNIYRTIEAIFVVIIVITQMTVSYLSEHIAENKHIKDDEVEDD